MPAKSGPRIVPALYIKSLRDEVGRQIEAIPADRQRFEGMLKAIDFFERAMDFVGNNGHVVSLYTLLPDSAETVWQGLYDGDGVESAPNIPAILIPCETTGVGGRERYHFDLTREQDQEIPITLAHEVVHAIDHMLFLKMDQDKLSPREKELYGLAKDLTPRLSTYDMHTFLDKERIFDDETWSNLEKDIVSLFDGMRIVEYDRTAIPEFLARIVEHRFSGVTLSEPGSDILACELYKESPPLLTHITNNFLKELFTYPGHQFFLETFPDRFAPELLKIQGRSSDLSARPDRAPQLGDAPEDEDASEVVTRAFGSISTSGRLKAMSFVDRYQKGDTNTNPKEFIR